MLAVPAGTTRVTLRPELQVTLERPESPPPPPPPSARERVQEPPPKALPKPSPRKADPFPQAPPRQKLGAEPAPQPSPQALLALPQQPAAPEPAFTVPSAPPAPEAQKAARAAPEAAPVAKPGPPRIVDAQPITKAVNYRGTERGTVTLMVLVNREGGVAEVKLEKTSGSANLDRHAIQAVKDWRFSPARSDGEAVEQRIPVRVTY
jgi:protein TonB